MGGAMFSSFNLNSGVYRCFSTQETQTPGKNRVKSGFRPKSPARQAFMGRSQKQRKGPRGLVFFIHSLEREKGKKHSYSVGGAFF